jgi:hypothetical protein
MTPHEWNEHTKRLLDVIAGVASVTAIGLSQVAAMVSIVAGLMSIAWLGIRIFDRLKYGRGGAE